ncbi:sorting nexin-20-like [Clytia hemisphaerica]
MGCTLDGENDGNEEDERNDRRAANEIPNVPQEVMKINFDIIQTKVISKGRRKFTVYVIIVMETPGLDADKAIIERRYNEFNALHKGLRKEFPKVMKNVPHFPRKKFFGSSLLKNLVEDRCRLFEKYLRYLYHQEGVAESKAFQKFFVKSHLKHATELLKCEQYEESCKQYQLAAHLQKKLGTGNMEDRIIALCGVVETCKNMSDYKLANIRGTECLEILKLSSNPTQYDVSNPFLLGLMTSVIDARKRENVDVQSWKGLDIDFRKCKEQSSNGHDQIESLRVLLVKKY